MDQSLPRDLLQGVLQLGAERRGGVEQSGVGDVAVEEEAGELGPGGEGKAVFADVEVLENGGQDQRIGKGARIRRRSGRCRGRRGRRGIVGVVGVVGVVDVLEVFENDLEDGDAEGAVVVEEAARGGGEVGWRVGFGHLGSDLVETFQENEDVVHGGNSDLKELLELR